MKSYNHLYEQFLSEDNIKLAIKNACKHKTNRKYFKDLKKNPDKYIDWFRRQATNYRNDNHKPIEIYDGIQRKKRIIIVPSFREQIIHHMVVNIIKPIIMKPMYDHSRQWDEIALKSGCGTPRERNIALKWIFENILIQSRTT